uniref:Triadin n=1 Tax=Myripristis murdjan TaxID=586833 RepID=A0A668A9P0_9TELE
AAALKLQENFTMSGGEAVPPSPRTTQRTLLDDLILTFTSPMAWLLVVALVITWSGVAIVLFDLLDYKTLAGNTEGNRKIIDAVSSKSLISHLISPHFFFLPEEGTDWLELLWSLAASLVAPDEEEEGIHQLSETLTCKKTSPHTN